MGIYWPNEISNYELRSKTYVRPVSLEVKHRCRKVGHIHRMPLVAIARQVSMRWSPDGKRKRGRPMETWRQSDNQQEVKEKGWSWREVVKLAKDEQQAFTGNGAVTHKQD